MYIDQMISIGKMANGYIVECRVPLKKDAKSSDKMSSCCCVSNYSCEKQYIAKDLKEVIELVGDVMPLLEEDFSKESEFDKAFEEATKEMEEENGKD